MGSDSRREEFSRIVDEYRSPRNEGIGDLDSRARQRLADMGAEVQHQDSVLIDVQLRAAMSESAFRIRRLLDKVADRVSGRAWTTCIEPDLRDPGAVLAAAGVDSADARQVLAEMGDVGAGERHTSL